MSETSQPKVAGATDAGHEPKPAQTDRGLSVWLVLCGLALLPGLLAAAKLGPSIGGPAGELIAALDRQLADIAFGRTPRFWLGVAGATMMGLLLLYPLRKLFGVGRFISVATWFHLHAVLGLLGPTLILYHCYFGTGSTPANVALFTMLAVVASGLFGRYVFTRLSAGHHGERKSASDHFEAAKGDLARLSATPSRGKLLEDLESFERQMAVARGGDASRRSWSSAHEAQSRDLTQRALWLLDNQGPQDGWSSAQCREAKVRVHAALTAHFQSLKRATRQSVYERLAGVWRLLHLPLFYVTVVATTIHVYNVWGLDHEPPPAEPPPEHERIAPPPATAGAPGPLITPRRVATSTEAMPKPGASVAEAAAPPPAPSATPGNTPEPKLVSGPVLKRESRAELTKAVEALPTPAATRPAAPEPIRDERETAAATKAPAGSAEPGSEVVRTARAEAGAPQAAPLPRKPAAPTAAAPAPAIKSDPVAQLAQKSAVLDNTGKLDPLVVRGRLAELKNDPAFDHAKTRFPLVGKHKRVACEQCHKTTLKDTPKDCIACHKKDDVHRGRRPNCAKCHTPVNWGTIIRN